MSRPQDITRRQALGRLSALLGGLVSAPTVAGVLSGCEPIEGAGWTPQVLTSEQNRMVTTIADILIPETDTPGARAAQVNRFIDAMLADSYPSEDRERFLGGLGGVNVRCKDAYDAPFNECDRGQQVTLVGEFDDETFGPDAPDPDPDAPSFFRMMKELVIIGYYTSAVGATEELQTRIVPGRYDGDVPYEEVGRAWSNAAT